MLATGPNLEYRVREDIKIAHQLFFSRLYAKQLIDIIPDHALQGVTSTVVEERSLEAPMGALGI
jgi:hypothetical protein